MAERMTAVYLKGKRNTGSGLADYGRVEPKDMIEQLRDKARRDLAAAQAILNAVDEDFIVETYKGIHVERERKQLWPLTERAAS